MKFGMRGFNLAIVVPQIGTIFSRSVLTLRKQKNKWQDDMLQKSDGAPGGIRTPDGLIRSQPLYPAEVRARFESQTWLNGVYYTAKSSTFQPQKWRRR